MKNISGKAILPHRLTAGLGMVLLAVVWSTGWLTSPPGLYVDSDHPMLMKALTALVLGAWNLLSCVIAAGFFHAASKHLATTFKSYRIASLRLVILGILFLFPVPLMTYVLGSELDGRAFSLLITGISFAGIVFGRARLKVIQERLLVLSEEDEPEKLTPLQLN